MQPTELTDLDVDRVDAVDAPATRRKFLIRKAADDDAQKGDPATEAMRLLRAAQAAVGKLHKSAATHADQGFVDAMNELAVAAGVTERFAKAADPDPAPEPPAEPTAKAAAAPAPAAAAATETPVAKALTADDIPGMAAAFGEAVVKAMRKDIEEDEVAMDAAAGLGAAATPPPSAQPAGSTSPVAKSARPAMGSGLFASVFRDN